MSVLLDTGILYAYYDRRDSWHGRSAELLRNETGDLIVPAPVIPEVDYLLGTRLGARAQLLFYQSLADELLEVVELPHGGYARVLELNRQFADLELGFVDAAVVTIAETFQLRRIATTDRKHFGAIAPRLKLILLP